MTTGHLQEAQRGEPYAPPAPPWIRINVKGSRTVYPWHYLDYTQMPEPGSPRVPIVCGGSIDIVNNAAKTVELSVADPPGNQRVCLRCISEMRQEYEPGMARTMTFWRARADGKPYLLMRRDDLIWCAIEISHIAPSMLDVMDPRQIVSDAIEEGREVLTGEQAREPDYTGYKFFGTRIHG